MAPAYGNGCSRHQTPGDDANGLTGQKAQFGQPAPQFGRSSAVHRGYGNHACALADPEIKPIEQNTARFYNRVSIDRGFGGIADDYAEGERLARALGNNSIMMMGNHGVLVAGATVAEAFDALYYLEKASQTMVLAYSTGQKLNIMPHELAEKTARGWESPIRIPRFASAPTPSAVRATFGPMRNCLWRWGATLHFIRSRMCLI